MNRNENSPNRSSLISDNSGESIKEYQKKGEKIRREKAAFLQRDFDYRDFIIAREGYEGVMLFIYLLILPYLVGLSFLFVFIARTSYEYFLEFNLSSYFVIWAIGYEVCAAVLLILFFYLWVRDTGSDEGVTNPRSLQTRFRN